MPRYARVSNESYESAANSGASELNRIREESIRGENEKRVAAYERMHLELEHAKQERQLAHDQAQTVQRIKQEYLMAEALPKLYAIDPSDPKATALRAQLVRDYPAALAIPIFSKEFEQHERLSGEYQRQATSIGARQDAADLSHQNAKEAAELRNQHSIELKQMSEQHAKALEPLKMATQVRGQLSSHQRQLDDAQKVIDHLEKTSVETNEPITSTGIFLDKDGKKRFGFTNVLKEESPQVTPQQEERYNNYKAAITRRDNFQSKVEQGNTQLDQLLSGDTAPPATEGDRPPAEPEPVVEAAPAAVAPANPNLAPTPAPVASPAVVPVPVAAVPAPVAPVAPLAEAAAPAATPHPYEGKRVLQKSTGKYGTFTNGQFVAE